jgi:hypothetical protein
MGLISLYRNIQCVCLDRITMSGRNGICRVWGFRLTNLMRMDKQLNDNYDNILFVPCKNKDIICFTS